MNQLLLLFFVSNIELLSGCAVRSSIRVPWTDIGGEETTVDHMPYHVQMEAEVSDDDWYMVCGAAIYKENIAIIVAHCVKPVGQRLELLRLRSSSSTTDEGGDVHKIVRIVPHPNAEKAEIGAKNDIALIQVEPPFKFDENCRPIGIAEAEPSANEVGIAGGFGCRGGKEGLSRSMREAKVEIIDRKTCKKEYKELDKSTSITQNSLCVSYPEESEDHRDACVQESGSPLAIDGKLVGLAALDKSCETSGFPGLYVNVPMFKDWIEQTAAAMAESNEEGSE